MIVQLKLAAFRLGQERALQELEEKLAASPPPLKPWMLGRAAAPAVHAGESVGQHIVSPEVMQELRALRTAPSPWKLPASQMQHAALPPTHEGALSPQEIEAKVKQIYQQRLGRPAEIQRGSMMNTGGFSPKWHQDAQAANQMLHEIRQQPSGVPAVRPAGNRDVTKVSAWDPEARYGVKLSTSAPTNEKDQPRAMKSESPLHFEGSLHRFSRQGKEVKHHDCPGDGCKECKR
jgi:hypothetical protein